MSSPTDQKLFISQCKEEFGVDHRRDLKNYHVSNNNPCMFYVNFLKKINEPNTFYGVAICMQEILNGFYGNCGCYQGTSSGRGITVG